MHVIDLTDLGPASPIMKGIRAVKAGDQPTASDLLQQGARQLIARGAQALVFGCTDISAALADVTEVDRVPVIDSSDSLARASLRLGTAAQHGSPPGKARHPR